MLVDVVAPKIRRPRFGVLTVDLATGGHGLAPTRTHGLRRAPPSEKDYFGSVASDAFDGGAHESCEGADVLGPFDNFEVFWPSTSSL